MKLICWCSRAGQVASLGIPACCSPTRLPPVPPPFARRCAASRAKLCRRARSGAECSRAESLAWRRNRAPCVLPARLAGHLQLCILCDIHVHPLPSVHCHRSFLIYSLICSAHLFNVASSCCCKLASSPDLVGTKRHGLKDALGTATRPQGACLLLLPCHAAGPHAAGRIVAPPAKHQATPEMLECSSASADRSSLGMRMRHPQRHAQMRSARRG